MKKLLITAILVMMVLFSLPSRVMAAPVSEDKVVMGGSFVLKPDETLSGNLIVIGGNATIEENATVQGDIILLGGQVSVSGHVTGNLNLFGGSASLRDTAVVDGNAVVTSSVLNKTDSATIKGNVIEGSELPSGFILPDRIKANPPSDSTPESGILGFFWEVLSIFFSSVTAAILAMLAALFFAEPMRRTASALVESPLMAAGAGLLTVIAAPIVVVLMSITLVLIPVSILLALALILAAFLGWITVGMELGNRLAMVFKAKWHLAISAGLGTLLLTLVMEVVGRIPCIGWTVVFVIGVLGLGAVILTRLGTRLFTQTQPQTSSANADVQ